MSISDVSRRADDFQCLSGRRNQTQGQRSFTDTPDAGKSHHRGFLKGMKHDTYSSGYASSFSDTEATRSCISGAETDSIDRVYGVAARESHGRWHMS